MSLQRNGRRTCPDSDCHFATAFHRIPETRIDMDAEGVVAVLLTYDVGAG